MKLLNRIKYKLLNRLLGELCMKSGGCRTCAARIGDVKGASFSCAHGYVYDQAEKVWKIPDPFNPLPRENNS